MDQVIRVKLRDITKRLSKTLTRLEILELLAKSGVEPKGALSNSSKSALLRNSLTRIPVAKLRKFVESVKTDEKSSQKVQGDIPTPNLHRSFKGTKVERFLKTGDYEEAIRVAFIRINNRVKIISGLSADGASLMRSAFSKNDPKIKMNAMSDETLLDEQEGIMHLFEGGMLAFRNPPSHDDEKIIAKDKALMLIPFANYLMTILDNPAG